MVYNMESGENSAVLRAQEDEGRKVAAALLVVLLRIFIYPSTHSVSLWIEELCLVSQEDDRRTSGCVFVLPPPPSFLSLLLVLLIPLDAHFHQLPGIEKDADDYEDEDEEEVEEEVRT